MNIKILKLANKCFADRSKNTIPTLTFMARDDELEAFYQAAFNAGMEEAAKKCELLTHSAGTSLYHAIHAIRALGVKE